MPGKQRPAVAARFIEHLHAQTLGRLYKTSAIRVSNCSEFFGKIVPSTVNNAHPSLSCYLAFDMLRCCGDGVKQVSAAFQLLRTLRQNSTIHCKQRLTI